VAPFTSPSRGFVADLLMPRVRRAGRHKNRATIAVSILGLAFLLASLLHSIPGKASETSTESPAPIPANDTYAFRVYPLNHTSTKTVGNGTAFLFDVAQLPINFSVVKFGDYKTDASYNSIYFAGSGILLNSSGTNAWIILREGNGKLVSNVFYHGQSTVVFNGQTTTYANCGRPAIYNGIDIMVQDWRKGNWTPNDGIIVEHPNNVTISGARFYLAVYQPAVSAHMPEFELLPAVACIFVVVILARRHTR
jgi:hypothetical protein